MLDASISLLKLELAKMIEAKIKTEDIVFGKNEKNQIVNVHIGTLVVNIHEAPKNEDESIERVAEVLSGQAKIIEKTPPQNLAPLVLSTDPKDVKASMEGTAFSISAATISLNEKYIVTGMGNPVYLTEFDRLEKSTYPLQPPISSTDNE